METVVKGWHFDPARKDVHAVPMVVSLDCELLELQGMGK
jgi:hypothetical protein